MIYNLKHYKFSLAENMMKHKNSLLTYAGSISNIAAKNILHDINASRYNKNSYKIKFSHLKNNYLKFGGL